MAETISTEREPYEPPTIEDVPLRTDEQLLVTCKHGGASGPGPINCFARFGPCQTISGS